MVEDGKFITHIVELGGNGEIHLLGAIRGQLDGAAVHRGGVAVAAGAFCPGPESRGPSAADASPPSPCPWA